MTDVFNSSGQAEDFIGLEIHDLTLWEPSRILPIIDTMQRWGYNALVLHQNDLLDASTQLFLANNYGVADLRLKKVRNITAWFNDLANRLSKFNAKLFLEIKEPSFHDYVLEEYPNLIGASGKPDPTQPSWAMLCRDKTHDLLERVPNLGGLIVNLSSPESRVSMPDHLSEADNEHDLSSWFDDMIEAFSEPLESKGKALYIRDFSYTTDMQSEVLSAVDRKNGKIGASVKITAHDYFPEYPQNPVARNVKSPLLFEFEAFGEHTGWGIIPNCRVNELCERMEGYRELGAHGMLVRTSWEAITGANALDCLSAVNVYALPKLIDGHIDASSLITDWLTKTYNLEQSLADQVTNLLLESWKIPAAAYWDKAVFPRHSCLPSTWQEGWLSMQTNGMGILGKNIIINNDDARLSDTAGKILFKEKESATELAKTLAQQAETLSLSLPKDLAKKMETFRWLPIFAKQFELAIKATFFAARNLKEEADELSKLQTELMDLSTYLEQEQEATPDIPHHHQILLSPEQIRLFASTLPV